MSTRSTPHHAPSQDSPRDDVTLLTVASVRAMKADYEADERLLADLPARVAEKKKRFEAALLFVTEDQRTAIFSESTEVVSEVVEIKEPLKPTIAELSPRRFVKSRNGRPTWTGLIMQVIENATEGLTHDQIMVEIGRLNPAFSKELGRNTKPYYHAMSKLEARKEIERRAGYFYPPGLIHRLPRQGEELPQKPRAGLKEYTSAWFINHVLEGAKEGMTAHDIKEALKDEEGVTPKLTSNSSFIFNVLKALQVDGYVEKDEETKKYYSSKVRPRGNGAS